MSSCLGSDLVLRSGPHRISRRILWNVYYFVPGTFVSCALLLGSTFFVLARHPSRPAFDLEFPCLHLPRSRWLADDFLPSFKLTLPLTEYESQFEAKALGSRRTHTEFYAPCAAIFLGDGSGSELGLGGTSSWGPGADSITSTSDYILAGPSPPSVVASNFPALHR
ncbi:hypothetical protein C8R44DRAFT_978305, partial [Mycena epipterygia]